MAATLGAALASCGSGETATEASREVALRRSEAGTTRSPAQQFLESVARRVGGARRDVREPAVVAYRQIEDHAVVYNAGGSRPFMLFGTTTRTVHVRSSRTSIAERDGPLRFATAASRRAWTESGKPRVAFGGSALRRSRLDASEFSFTPKGSPFTYRDARRLVGPVAHVERIVRDHTGGTDRLLLARQYGYLLAVAPVKPSARAAMLRALAGLPGVHLCGRGPDLAGRTGTAVCIGDADTQYRLLVNGRTGLTLSIEEQIVTPTDLFPTLPGGTVTQRDTFVLARAAKRA